MAQDSHTRQGSPAQTADVSRLKERIDAFADFNLPRPHFLSVGEYLDRLVETDVLSPGEAAAVRRVYYRSRYAHQKSDQDRERNTMHAAANRETPEEDQIFGVLRQLEQARVRLERHDDSERTRLSQRWQTLAEKSSPEPAAPPPRGNVGRTARKKILKRKAFHSSRDIPGSTSDDVKEREVNGGQAAESHGASRWRSWLLSLAAPAFLIWTAAAMGLTYWGHGHIDAKIQEYVSRWRYGASRTEYRQTISQLRRSTTAAKGPKRVAMLERLATAYTVRGAIGEAAVAYRLALVESPRDPELLNNLAWLLLTADDAYYRSPQQALPLAKRAHELRAAAHIKDTLAEAYYQTGNSAAAIVLERQALDMRPPKAPFYLHQLEKFRNADQGHL